MAKQKKMRPARKHVDRSRGDQSLLLRSAESLGRVIGLLQRQLDGASKRLSTPVSDGDAVPPLPKNVRATRRGTKKRSAAPHGAGAKNTKSAARKSIGTAARKSPGTAARKKARQKE